ncbi:hypothetical protein [Kitasatospora sp. NPDC057015]|uniref:hypothetical protein n=1 Tax=Kitasatospora sp. NPDC057015 TaxID=3346001 RepID=UPI003645A795
MKYCFYEWRDDGTDEVSHDLMRQQVREGRGRLADPVLVVLDTRSLHAAAGVPVATTGRTPPGRCRAASAGRLQNLAAGMPPASAQ